MNIYEDLNQLLTDYEKDKQHVKSNQELCMGYIDEFHDMLVRLKTKLEGIHHILYDRLDYDV